MAKHGKYGKHGKPSKPGIEEKFELADWGFRGLLVLIGMLLTAVGGVVLCGMMILSGVKQLGSDVVRLDETSPSQLASDSTVYVLSNGRIVDWWEEVERVTRPNTSGPARTSVFHVNHYIAICDTKDGAAAVHIVDGQFGSNKSAVAGQVRAGKGEIGFDSMYCTCRMVVSGPSEEFERHVGSGGKYANLPCGFIANRQFIWQGDNEESFTHETNSDAIGDIVVGVFVMLLTLGYVAFLLYGLISDDD